jgi:uncharacterized protein YjbI with pentapeptide repeats
MANDEHVALLKQDVAAWNKWRDENLDVLHPDLNGADLHGANLRGANLRRANLSQANIRRADLRKADLIGDKNHLKVFATADAAKCQSMFEARQAENGGTD